MQKRFVFCAVLALLSVVSMSPAGVRADTLADTPMLAVPIGGIAPDRMGHSVCVSGAFWISSFSVETGQLTANGTIHATVGNCLSITATLVQELNLPVTALNGDCTSLSVTFGQVPFVAEGRTVVLNAQPLIVLAGQIDHSVCGVTHGAPEAVARNLNRLFDVTQATDRDHPSR